MDRQQNLSYASLLTRLYLLPVMFILLFASSAQAQEGGGRDATGKINSSRYTISLMDNSAHRAGILDSVSSDSLYFRGIEWKYDRPLAYRISTERTVALTNIKSLSYYRMPPAAILVLSYPAALVGLVVSLNVSIALTGTYENPIALIGGLIGGPMLVRAASVKKARMKELTSADKQRIIQENYIDMNR